MTHPLPDALRDHCKQRMDEIRHLRLQGLAMLAEANLAEQEVTNIVILAVRMFGLPDDGRRWRLLPDGTAVTDDREESA